MICVTVGEENEVKLDVSDVIKSTTSGANFDLSKVKFVSSMSQAPNSVFRVWTHRLFCIFQ